MEDDALVRWSGRRVGRIGRERRLVAGRMASDQRATEPSTWAALRRSECVCVYVYVESKAPSQSKGGGKGQLEISAVAAK